MTLKNNRAPLLCCFKLCASFHSHGWIQTGVTVQKHSIRVKISNILSCVTFKFDRWPWKTIGHLSYAASSFVHHFIAMGEFKLELQSGKTQFRSKSTNFFSGVTLKFDGWPWKTIGHLKQHQALCIISSPYVNSNWSYNPEMAKWDHDFCDLDLWPWLFAWTSRLSLAGFAFTASPNGKDVKLTPLDVKIFDSQVPTVASNYLQGPHRESPKAMSKLSDTLIESHLGQRRYQSQITIIFNQLHIVSHSWSGISQEKYIFNHTH